MHHVIIDFLAYGSIQDLSIADVLSDGILYNGACDQVRQSCPPVFLALLVMLLASTCDTGTCYQMEILHDIVCSLFNKEIIMTYFLFAFKSASI